MPLPRSSSCEERSAAAGSAMFVLLIEPICTKRTGTPSGPCFAARDDQRFGADAPEVVEYDVDVRFEERREGRYEFIAIVGELHDFIGAEPTADRRSVRDCVPLR